MIFQSLWARVLFITCFAVIASLMNCVGQVRSAYQGKYSFILTEIVLACGYIGCYFGIFLFRLYVTRQISREEVEFVWGKDNIFLKGRQRVAATRGTDARSPLVANSSLQDAGRTNSNLSTLSSRRLVRDAGSSASISEDSALYPASYLEQWLKNAFFSPGPVLPMYVVLVFAGIFDCVSEVLGFLVQPYMRVFTRSLITQSNMLFTSLWSINLLDRRYVFAECLAIVLAVVGTLIDVYGNLTKKEAATLGHKSPAAISEIHRGGSDYSLIEFLSSVNPRYDLSAIFLSTEAKTVVDSISTKKISASLANATDTIAHDTPDVNLGHAESLTFTAGTPRDSPLAVLILFFSCATPVMVLKEMVYLRWRQGYATQQRLEREDQSFSATGLEAFDEEPKVVRGREPPGNGHAGNNSNSFQQHGEEEEEKQQYFPVPNCDVFVVSSASNLFSAAFAPFLIYLLTRLQIPSDVSFWAFLCEAMHELVHDPDVRFWTMGAFLPINLVMNVMVLFILSSSGGALLLYVSMKLTLPLSVIFAIILPWPAVIGSQTITLLEAVGGALVFSAAFLFLKGNKEREVLLSSSDSDQLDRTRSGRRFSEMSIGSLANTSRSICMYPYKPYFAIPLFLIPIALGAVILGYL